MTSGGPISFARGAPSLDIIDAQGLCDAAQRAMTYDPAGAFSYGTAAGYPPLREWIAERHDVDLKQVLVTNGSMQADAFLFELMVTPGDAVVVERPTYDRTLLNLCNRGAEIHAIEMETDGIDVAKLEELVAGGTLPRLAHIIPNFQNPAGYTLSAEKRARLVELAAGHGFLIFEDDPYQALRFEGEPLPTMFSLDGSGRVAYVSSFTKTVCPGVRVGYIVGPADLVADVRALATNTYISPGMVSQAIVNEFCRSGALERSIETIRSALSERLAVLTGALERELPEASFTAPTGGYFLWVEMPEGTDMDALHAAAVERGVQFVKGSDFVLAGGENALRLAFAGVSAEQIDDGISRLAEAARSVGVPA